MNFRNELNIEVPMLASAFTTKTDFCHSRENAIRLSAAERG